MIIHLEASWDDAVLERFALIVSQRSLHFALQFNWILQGAMEDYQPEGPDGKPNPAHNPLFYSRCVKLLGNVEMCVAYGTPRTHELRKLYEGGLIDQREYELMEQADRRFNAAQIVSREDDDGASEGGSDWLGGMLGGVLLYKRRVRTKFYKRKPWKERYFAMSERMLLCYNVHPDLPGSHLVRAMPLAGAEISDIEGGKYPSMFSISNKHFDFRVRAKDHNERGRWVKALREEAKAKAGKLFPHQIGGGEARATEEMKEGGEGETSDEAGVGVGEGLSPAQRLRYDFFEDERSFVYNLCNLAEDLRFKQRDERKKLAPSYLKRLPIPECCYIPLCNSTDVWQRVHSPVPAEVRVFNTNERCPVIMYFVSKRGESLHRHRGGMRDAVLDVAEYMHLQYEVPDDLGHQGLISSIPPLGRLSGINEVTEEDNTEDEESKSESETAMAPIVGQGLTRIIEGEDIKAEESPNGGGDIELLVSGSGEIKLSTSGSAEDEGKGRTAMIWSEESRRDGEEAQPTIGKGNARVQRFAKENLVRMPSNLLKHIATSTRKMSFLDRAVGPVDAVPIVEIRSEGGVGATTPGGDISDDQSVGSVGMGSILTRDGSVLTDLVTDGIDKKSLDKAKAIMCRGESWANKSARLLREIGDKKGGGGEGDRSGSDAEAMITEIVSVMAKSNDDLRQEVFIMQMIHFYQSVFAKARLPIWLFTYRILSTAKDTGLIEVINDASSIDGLKKADGFPAEGGLRAYFDIVYGPSQSRSFLNAQRNFMLSLVGYSLVSWILGLKDRHNGNIMIDLWGHIIHIDFGFVMGMAPGHEFSMERAPFKLTKDYMDVMGGPKSECFAEFKRLFVAGFEAARANALVALGLVEIMMYKSNYPCFSGSRYGGGVTLKRFEERLMLHDPDSKVKKFALHLIDASMDNTGTHLYDLFQQHSNGYAI